MTTLVLGGTGKTGRRVAQRLTARDLPVRIGSRSGEPPFDWNDRASWAPALEGMEAAYVVYYPDLAMPEAAGAIRSFAELAMDRGVRRLVLLSGRGEEGALASERALQDSGADWTVVRATWFSQNFSEDYLLEPVLSGQIALPAGDVEEPFVDAGDVADVAVAALTEQGHTGEVYEVTGRHIDYVPVSPEEYAAGAAEHGVPAEYATFLTELFAKVLDGRNAHLTDGVQRALGRQPRDFSDYARDAAATGVWNGR